MNMSSYALIMATHYVVWIAGIVLAKGFISTAFAICTGGLWSWYLVIEKVFMSIGWV